VEGCCCHELDGRATAMSRGLLLASTAVVFAGYAVRRWRRRRRPRPSITLTYFDMPGKAQAIRFAFALGNRAFRDVRLSVDEYYAQQAANALPFGSMPVLDVGGERIGQSDAILRYAGRVAGLAPADPVVQARIDQWVALEADFSYPFTMALFPDKCYLSAWPAEEAASFRLSILAQHVPTFLAFVEAALEKSPTGWLAATPSPSIADLAWAPRLRWLESGSLGWLPPSILQPFPRARALVDRVYALPAVVAFSAREHAAARARAAGPSHPEEAP